MSYSLTTKGEGSLKRFTEKKTNKQIKDKKIKQSRCYS